MLAWIVSAIATVFNFVPTTIWVIIFWVGTFIFWIGGEGLLGFPKIVLGIGGAYLVLYILAALFPAWLEAVVVLGIIGLYLWILHN